MLLRIATIAFVASSLLATTILAAEPATPHEERLNAWRQAGDFAAAEDYCRKQLSRTALTNAERHELTLELARLSLEHVLQSPDQDADKLWEAATRTTNDYAQQYPNNPRLAQLLVQSGLAHSAHAELLRSIDTDPEAANEPARAELREAIKLLRKARERIEAETRNAPRSARREVPIGAITPWSVDELRSLDRNVRFELAKSLRRQAEAYPTGSEDRTHAATQAVELFRTLAELQDSEPLAWPSGVQLIACERLLQHWNEADQGVKQCQIDQLPSALRGPLRAEMLRLALAREDVDAALKLAVQPDDDGREHVLDEDLALLEVHLAAAQSASERKEQAAAAHHAAEASRRVRVIGNRWGAFWGEHAAARLARHLTSGDSAADHQAWAQAGDALYQQGQADQALAAYDQAREQAVADGAGDAIMLLGMKGAAVEQAREQFPQAAERFRAAALGQPQHPRAADAHLAAIHNLARSAATIEAQSAWLEEHLQHWPNAETSAQVRVWLAASRAERRDWRATVELLAKVEGSDPLAAEAIRAAQGNYGAWLLELPSGAERQTVVDSAIRHFTGYCHPATESEAADSTSLLAAAAAAELLIRERRTYPEAERLLNDVLERAPRDKSVNHIVAEAWLFTAQAAQPAKLSASRAQFATLPEIPSETLEAVLEALAALAKEEDAAALRERALLRLDLINRRRAVLSEVDEQGRRHWELERAVALGDAGRQTEAIQTLQHRRQTSPQDVSLAAALGRLLAESTTQEAWTEALDCWRTVERESPAGSKPWFEAKYSLAELHFRLGDRERAAKIILLTRTLHPELGGAAWKGRFEKLLGRCEAD